MQFVSSSQHPGARSPQAALPHSCDMEGITGGPELCGWFDSSFDLAHGLLVVEQDDDSLYQLWKLSRH